MRRTLLLGALLVALISLAEARQLGLLPATRQEDAYSLQFPNLYGGGGNTFARGGGGTTIPFWRLPPLWRQGIYSPRFGLGPLALGLGLSPAASAVGAPGQVPVGRRAQAAKPETPAERATRLERMGQSGSLPQAGANLVSLEEAVQRGLLPASALPPRPARPPVPAPRPAGPAPAQAPAQPPAPTVSNAAQMQAALQAAGGVAKLGGQVAQAVASPTPELGVLSTLTPEQRAMFEEQRRGERAEPQDLALARAAALNAARLRIGAVPFTHEFTDPRFPDMVFPSTGPITGVETTPLAPGPPNLIIDPVTGHVIDPVTGQDFAPGTTIPPAPGLDIDPTTGLPLSGDFGEGTDIIPANWVPPEGRAVGAGPIASPTSAQRATTAPTGTSWFTSLARSAAPALNLAVPALSTGAGAYQLSQGNPAGAVPLGFGSLQLAEAIRTGKVPIAATGPYNLAASGLQGAGLLSGLLGGPPELGLGLSTAGSLAAALPTFIPGTVANTALLSALGPGAAGVTGAGAGAGATAGGAVAGGTGAAGTAAGTGGVLAGAGAALAAIAPVMAMYAIGTTLGGLREADIERGYQRQAKEAASALTSSPDYQTLGSNLARYRGGDRSVLPKLISVAQLADIAADRLAQPEGGSGLGAGRIVQGIYQTTLGPAGEWTPDYDRVVRGVARFDPVTSAGRDYYAAMVEFGRPSKPPVLPPDYNIPEPSPWQAVSPQADPWRQYRPLDATFTLPPAPGPFGTYVQPPPVSISGSAPRSEPVSGPFGTYVQPPSPTPQPVPGPFGTMSPLAR